MGARQASWGAFSAAWGATNDYVTHKFQAVEVRPQ
jgi:hypothetical protein